MSETLFFVTGVSGGLAWNYYLRGNRQPLQGADLSRAYLLIASLLTAAAFLSRYVGMAFLVSGVFLLFLNGRKTWLKRWQDIFWFASLPAIGMLLWLAYNRFQPRGLVVSSLGEVNPWAAAGKLRIEVGKAFVQWLPGLSGINAYSGQKLAMLAVCGTILLLIGLSLWKMRRSGLENQAPLLWWIGYFGIFGVIYLVVYALRICLYFSNP